MRLLGFLALAAPVVLGILLLALPPDMLSGLGDRERSVVAAVTAAAIGVYLTAGVVELRAHVRLRRLIRAAERIADGDYTVRSHGARREPRGATRPAPSTGSRRRSRTPTTGPRSTG